MQLLSKIKEIFGLLPQEYVCVAKETLSDHPSVFLTAGNTDAFADVTAQHVFLGYKPVVIAIDVGHVNQALQQANRICLSFTHDEFHPDTQWRSWKTSKNCVARLELTRTDDKLNIPGVAFYVGSYAEQEFLRVHQLIANTVVDSIRRKPFSEANLAGNEYDQVRTAYSVPRGISVITVKDHELLNFFPTDLHGRIGEYYLSSLRIGGMACNQVQDVKRIVLSTVDVAAFRKTYQLGKNHMKPLQPASVFELSNGECSSGIPVYPNAVDYLELEWIRHWDIGIHRIFLYQINGGGKVREGKTLAHIHCHYAQWRLNHQFSAEYFYR